MRRQGHEPTEQTIVRTFSGNRFIGDPLQDEIFITRLYDMSNRIVPVYDYYDNMTPEQVTQHGNAWSQDAAITISDDGSGDAPSRENIGFSLTMIGTPVRGTLVVAGTVESPTYTFTPLSP